MDLGALLPNPDINILEILIGVLVVLLIHYFKDMNHLDELISLVKDHKRLYIFIVVFLVICQIWGKHPINAIIDALIENIPFFGR